MSGPNSDALAVFGVTGGLADKMIFPALHALVESEALGVRVVGVAAPAWSREQPSKRIEDSFERSGGVDDPTALGRLLALLTWVSGDYKDAATFASIKKALGGASRPAHCLAIPPSLFETVIEGLALFAREDAVDAAWAAVDPILDNHAKVVPCQRGGWGPEQSDALIAAGGGWDNPSRAEPPRGPRGRVRAGIPAVWPMFEFRQSRASLSLTH